MRAVPRPLYDLHCVVAFLVLDEPHGHRDVALAAAAGLVAGEEVGRAVVEMPARALGGVVPLDQGLAVQPRICTLKF